MDIQRFQASKRTTSLPVGSVAYADIGEGPVALFVHGVFMSSVLWRTAIEQVADLRRCIAIDLPAHGDTHVGADFPYSLAAHARLVVDLLDALGIDQADLVGNDTGGAVAQLVAARHADRLRTLTLTNCDVHDNFPPEAFKGTVELAGRGELAPLIEQLAADPEVARSKVGLGVGYQYPERITDEQVAALLGRFSDPGAAREIERRVAAIAGDGGLMEIEPDLRGLHVPTLLVWGTDDVFFDLASARWLRDTIPGVTELVEIPGGKLFFVDERGDELAVHLRRHWALHEPVAGGVRAQGGS